MTSQTSLADIQVRLRKGAELIEQEWQTVEIQPWQKRDRKRLDALLLRWIDLMGGYFAQGGTGCAMGEPSCKQSWTPLSLCWHCAGGHGLPPWVSAETEK